MKKVYKYRVMVTVPYPDVAGFAEPVWRAPMRPLARFSRLAARRPDSMGPVLLLVLLAAAFVPSVLADFNLHLIPTSLASQPDISPAFAPPANGEKLGCDAVCSIPCVADSAAPVLDGAVRPYSPAETLGREVRSIPFRSRTGSGTPRAPPV